MKLVTLRDREWLLLVGGMPTFLELLSKKLEIRMETILTACVMLNGKIPLFCKRHGDGIFVAKKIYGLYIDRIWQGFWTDDGRFLNRKEAMKLAKENGQLKKLDEDGKPIDYSGRYELYSEDLR